MCQPLPGVRCAHHVGKQLVIEREMAKVVDQKIASMDEHLARYKEKYPNREPDPRGYYEEKRRHLLIDRANIQETINDLSHAYDITRTGRKELAAELERAEKLGVKTKIARAAAKLANAEHDYALARRMTKDQTAGLAQFQSAAENLKSVDPELRVFLNRAQEEWANAKRAEHLTKTDYSESRPVSLMSLTAQANSESAFYRRVTGEKVLADDSYEPGIYGVFHGHDGSLYLSKVTDKQDGLGPIEFENGTNKTSFNSEDVNQVLVEKGSDGFISGRVQEERQLEEATGRGFNRMGVVSHDILSEVSPRNRPLLTKLAESTSNNMSKLWLTGKYEHKDVDMLFQRAFKPKTKEEELLKGTLVRAWRYAIFSPNADNSTRHREFKRSQNPLR